MSFPFSAPPRAYRAAAPETPYRRAAQEWDARMGSAVLSARSWRAFAIAALGAAVFLGFGAVMVAMQKRTFVYVAEVSPAGEVMNVRTLDGAWRPQNAEIAHHLRQFVRLVRSLSTDGVVLRENWIEAYKFLSPKGAAHLSEIARQDDPFLSLGRVGRTVHVQSVLQRSDDTWEVRWAETATNATGSGDTQLFTGLFTVNIVPPRNADEVASNPLGLRIDEFSWSREQ